VKKTLLVLALVAAVAAVPLLAACSCGGGTSLTESDIKTIRGFPARLDTLDGKTSKLNGKGEYTGTLDAGIATLSDEDAAAIADVATLRSELDALKAGDNETTIAELEARIAALEDEAGTGGNGEDGETVLVTTRWQEDVYVIWPSGVDENDYEVSYKLSPPRVREEDTYKFTVAIKNKANGSNTGEVEDVYLVVSFDPTSNDTSVDIGNTGIYTISSQYFHGVWWDSEYNPTDGVNCRSIEFSSDEFDLPSLDDGETLQLSFDFDLYYAD